MEKAESIINQNEYVTALSRDSAIRILLDLCKDNDLAKRIYTMAKAFLSDVDADEIADDVFDSLNAIEVEDLWDNSGNTRYGYQEPAEVAYEMLESALSNYMIKMAQYEELDMKKEEKEYCKGIISGLHKYATEGSNEFSDWAPDDTYTIIENILYDWKKCNTAEDIEEVQAVYDSFFSDDNEE